MSAASVAGPAAWSEANGAGAGVCLFVIHAKEDEWFVNDHLLPSLGVPRQHVLLSSRLPLGEVKLRELGRGATSLITVAVLSPAFARTPLARFAGDLAAMHSVETDNRGGVLVPALLEDCEVDLHLQRLVPLDFRGGSHWPRELARLRERIEERLAERQRLAAQEGTRPSAPVQLAPRPSPAQLAFHDPMLALRLLELHENDPVARPRTANPTLGMPTLALFSTILLMLIGLVHCSL